MSGAAARLEQWFSRCGGVYLLPVTVAMLAYVIIPSPSSWLTLTVAGLSMGMMLFLMAAGLSLVFGLMDVLNFGHSAFISFGAFITATVLSLLSSWLDYPWLGLLALLLAMMAAIGFGLVAGYVFETLIIKPVYRDHLRQILITMGALIVAEQSILMIWGGSPITVPRPASLQGALILGETSISIYRPFVFLLGAVIYFGLYLLLNRTRIGLLIRAGVENPEMVEALGFRVNRLFILVFALGSALAALGGAMWAGYETLITPALGTEMLVVVFIVVIIGGLGSIEGTLLGALMVGLTLNYVGFIAPKLALASNMLLMLLVLLWRPRGLAPAVK